MADKIYGARTHLPQLWKMPPFLPVLAEHIGLKTSLNIQVLLYEHVLIRHPCLDYVSASLFNFFFFFCLRVL